MVSRAEGLGEMADLLGVSVEAAAAVLGGPWSAGEPGTSAWGDSTTFTGRENPRTPGRPLVALVVDHAERTVEVGHAVGVPLPDGSMRWTLGEPRTLVPLDEADLVAWVNRDGRVAASTTPEGLSEAMLQALGDGIQRVADVAMLRGAQW